MGDLLTQLQDAVDQLAQQFVASVYFVNKHHDLEKLSPSDTIRELKPEEAPRQVEPIPADEFKSGQLELARDLIYKEQQIEVLISNLPGLDNSEADQERFILDLEQEIQAAEAQRQAAAREKDAVLALLDRVVVQRLRRP